MPRFKFITNKRFTEEIKDLRTELEQLKETKTGKSGKVKSTSSKDERLDKLVPPILKGLIAVLRAKGMMKPSKELEDKVREVMDEK